MKVTRRLTIYQFWRLRSELLREIHYKNILEEHRNGGFQLVNENGEIEEEENIDYEHDLVSKNLKK